MRVLITGGVGYIGYDLVLSLQEKDEIEEIVVYDNLYRKNYNFFFQEKSMNKVEFVNEDLLNEFALKQALKGIDIVVHLAAHVDYPYSYRDNIRYEQINQFGTSILVNALRESKPQKVIYASSGSVYGFQENSNEDSEPLPENAYGKSKYEGEKYIQLLKDVSEISILRIGNIFGFSPMLRFDTVINKFIIHSLLFNKIQIMGTGNQYRPFIKLSNVVDYISKEVIGVIEKPIINLVQDSISMNDLLRIMMNVHPNLEFIRINANHELKGYRMSSKFVKFSNSIEKAIKLSYDDFKEKFTLR